jgi:hypothetical protein
MDDVTSKVNAKVSTNGTRLGIKRHGLSHHLTSLLDNIKSLPAHAYNGSRGKERTESTEEFLSCKILVVLLCLLERWLFHLESDKLVSTLFETRDDISDKSALDSVRLYCDEGTFGSHIWYLGFGMGWVNYGKNDEKTKKMVVPFVCVAEGRPPPVQI